MEHTLTFWQAYGFCVLGILASIALPLLRAKLPKPPALVAATGAGGYLAMGAVSLVGSILVMAFAGDAVRTWTWQAAVLAGYAWDSTIQKIGKG